MQSEISESVQRRRWLAGSCSAGAKGVAGAARGETAAGVTETAGGDARRVGCALRRYGYAARTASSTAVSQLSAKTYVETKCCTTRLWLIQNTGHDALVAAQHARALVGEARHGPDPRRRGY